MVWTIEYSRSAWQQLKKLNRQTAKRILDSVDMRLATRYNPRDLDKPLSGLLWPFWSYRIGDRRLVCDIQDSGQRILACALASDRESTGENRSSHCARHFR